MCVDLPREERRAQRPRSSGRIAACWKAAPARDDQPTSPKPTSPKPHVAEPDIAEANGERLSTAAAASANPAAPHVVASADLAPVDEVVVVEARQRRIDVRRRRRWQRDA